MRHRQVVEILRDFRRIRAPSVFSWICKPAVEAVASAWSPALCRAAPAPPEDVDHQTRTGVEIVQRQNRAIRNENPLPWDAKLARSSGQQQAQRAMQRHSRSLQHTWKSNSAVFTYRMGRYCNV